MRYIRKASPKEMVSTDDANSLEFWFIDNARLAQTLSVSARIISITVDLHLSVRTQHTIFVTI